MRTRARIHLWSSCKSRVGLCRDKVDWLLRHSLRLLSAGLSLARHQAEASIIYHPISQLVWNC